MSWELPAWAAEPLCLLRAAAAAGPDPQKCLSVAF